MIPKVVYKTAPSLNPTICKLNNELEKINKGWVVKFYDNQACLDFLINDFQNDNVNFKNNVIRAYNILIPGAYKADLWRLCIIYQYGGVYIDATSRFYIPINKIFDLNKAFNIALDNPGMGLQISFFGSVKNHPYLRNYICQIVYHIKINFYGNSPLCPTGPMCAFWVAKKYGFLKGLNIKVRNNWGTYKMIKTGEIVGKRKSINHNKAIRKNKVNSYINLWRNKLIYRTINRFIDKSIKQITNK